MKIPTRSDGVLHEHHVQNVDRLLSIVTSLADDMQEDMRKTLDSDNGRSALSPIVLRHWNSAAALLDAGDHEVVGDDCLDLANGIEIRIRVKAKPTASWCGVRVACCFALSSGRCKFYSPGRKEARTSEGPVDVATSHSCCVLVLLRAISTQTGNTMSATTQIRHVWWH